MSQENLEAFNRAVDAFDRQDFEAMLEELDAAVEWYDAAPMLLGGEATVYRGHEGDHVRLDRRAITLDGEGSIFETTAMKKLGELRRDHRHLINKEHLEYRQSM